jgi:glycosyltransferase involved in cell wall biosynthesis
LKPPSIWHIITCEYPPQSGGVSDYSYLVARELALAGDQVHVWGPGRSETSEQAKGVAVHAIMGTFSPKDLKATGRRLDGFTGPRHLLIQWVPHGYGYKSLNVGFCLWLVFRRAIAGDRLDWVVHEPFLPFKKGKWRQNAAAVLHRLMMVVILRTAWRVWLSTPAWEPMIRPFGLGRKQAYHWLPLPSNVPVAEDTGAGLMIHQQYAPNGVLIGHFGTFGAPITPLLAAAIPPLLRRVKQASMLLIGPGSLAFRDALAHQHPDLGLRLHAIGQLDARDARLSVHLSACDLMLQPFPDGVTSRRTSVMAALAHGRPTATTSGPLTEAFWSQSGAVFLAPVADPQALVEGAAQILEDPRRRVSLGEAGREFYWREFDMPHIVERLRAV